LVQSHNAGREADDAATFSNAQLGWPAHLWESDFEPVVSFRFLDAGPEGPVILEHADNLSR
jgi:hypothetical protein